MFSYSNCYGANVTMNQSTTARRIRNFSHRPWFEKAWFFPVWLLLGASRMFILAVPFRHLAPRLGKHAGVASWVPLVDAGCEARAASIARVVQMAARHTPWVSNCFSQAVAARLLLGLYGVPYCLFFGVTRNQAETMLNAHAWVVAGRVRVTGGASFDQFAVVSCFVSPRLATTVDQPR